MSSSQSYANHRLRLKPIFTVAGALLLAACAMFAVELERSRSLASLGQLLLALGALALWWSQRSSDLRLQDRLIRAEMNARLERVLGASRRLDIARLSLKQLIALRFASDAELPGLVLEILAGTTTEPDAIKRKIRDWQADHLRV